MSPVRVDPGAVIIVLRAAKEPSSRRSFIRRGRRLLAGNNATRARGGKKETETFFSRVRLFIRRSVFCPVRVSRPFCAPERFVNASHGLRVLRARQSVGTLGGRRRRVEFRRRGSETTGKTDGTGLAHREPGRLLIGAASSAAPPPARRGIDPRAPAPVDSAPYRRIDAR